MTAQWEAAITDCIVVDGTFYNFADSVTIKPGSSVKVEGYGDATWITITHGTAKPSRIRVSPMIKSLAPRAIKGPAEC
jgi:hypothetical protein